MRLPWWKVWSTRLGQWVMPIQEWVQRRRGWRWRASPPQCTTCTATTRGSNSRSDWVGTWSLGDSRTFVLLDLSYKLISKCNRTTNSDPPRSKNCACVMIIMIKLIKFSTHQWGGGCAPLTRRKASGSTNKFITGEQGFFLQQERSVCEEYWL